MVQREYYMRGVCAGGRHSAVRSDTGMYRDCDRGGTQINRDVSARR